MAAQTLDQVLSSLQSVYQPQIDSINQQQAALPAQYDAQAQGLQAAQTQSFGDILNGARARGTGVAFGGIPLSEQAQYTASTYLPALANLKTSQNQQSQSLVDALNKINEDKFNTANGIYQYDNTLAENQREFDAQQAATKAGQDNFNPTLALPSGAGTPAGAAAGGAKALDPTQAKTLSGGKSQQDAYNAVQALMQTRNTSLIANTYNAIAASAKNGNTYDQTKLQLLEQLYAGSLSKNNIGTPTKQTNTGSVLPGSSFNENTFMNGYL